MEVGREESGRRERLRAVRKSKSEVVGRVTVKDWMEGEWAPRR